MRKIDTLVIGGGIAGLSAAARFVRHGETVVLEAEDALGYHASGRSVSFCHFGLGDELVKKLTALSSRHFAASADSDEPVATRHAALHIAGQSDLAKLDAYEAVHRRHAPGYARLSGEEAKSLVPILKAGPEGVAEAIYDPDAFKLDSDAMLQAHRREIVAAGGEIILGARATGIARTGDRWTVETAGESYAARRLVNAAGAWADEIAAMAGVVPIGIEPRRRTVIAFDAPEDMDVSAWPFTKTVAEQFYMLPEGAGRLLASPMDETVSAPSDASPEEIDIATIAWRIEQATTLAVPRIAHSWAGLRSFAPDEHPVVGYAADTPGFFWLAGQGGFGLQTSPAMARAAEALLFGLDWPEEFAAAGIAPPMLQPERLMA